MILHFLKVMWGWLRGAKLLPKHLIRYRSYLCDQCHAKREGLIRNYCHYCSCTVSEGRHPFNKLAHPCEECPLKKWSKFSTQEKPCE